MKDITNKKFGLLTAISIAETDDTSRTKKWILKCECGNVIKRALGTLNSGERQGLIQSCGCHRTAKIDVARSYGWLKPIERTNRKKEGKGWLWKFECICGNITEKYGSEISRNHGAQHCGCKTRTKGPNTSKGFGALTGKRWAAIMYGATKRGLDLTITIEEAAELFENQNRQCALSGWPINLPINHKDKSGTASLDRIDSSKGYVKGNVQWLHKDVNRAKGAKSDCDFINLCVAIATHNTAK